MCGIAGMVDLGGRRLPPPDAVERMARALIHRGPDDQGTLIRPGIGLVSRRLSIVGLSDGRQPMENETGEFVVVFNGELFDHVERRNELLGRGHRLVTRCDTEIIPHLWEELGEETFEALRGQFAIALWDARRRTLFLGRDRFGIAPLYWTRQGDWLLFASEIKGLLASGLVPARPDLRGIDQLFSFSAIPGPVTCFEGIRLLPPAHRLRIDADHGDIDERAYWKMDFPDAGQERDTNDPKEFVDALEQRLCAAVDERLRADVPVGSYLSGGVDSSMILALASRSKSSPISTYTVQVKQPGLDELSAATRVARHLGVPDPIVHEFDAPEAVSTYPHLIIAAEAPVIDTSCAALLGLASKVHACGQKVVLTGEGADEWLLGYPWYKAARLLGHLDRIPGLELSNHLRRAFLRLQHVPQYPRTYRQQIEEAIGGPNAWIDAYGVLSLSKLRFYSDRLHDVRRAHNPWAELGLDPERARRWHPQNRGVWIAARVNLAGHLLQAKGDRVAMHSSVEVRYPFLDEDVFDFLAQIHPRWKMRRLRDKHLLRLLAERYLPEDIYRRGKVIFRAPLDSFHVEPEPPYVAQLLSEESLRRTGYFDPAAVHHWRKNFRTLRSLPRLSVEMGLMAVVSTQLWHHQFIDPTLADLPSAA